MDWFTRCFPAKHKLEQSVMRQEVLPGIGAVSVVCVVDCLGAMCPRPQLLTRKVVEQLVDGDVIEVVSDNPAVAESFPWLAEALMCTFLSSVREGGRWRLFLRKGLG